jgi:hypothetical protein
MIEIKTNLITDEKSTDQEDKDIAKSGKSSLRENNFYITTPWSPQVCADVLLFIIIQILFD